MGGNKTKFGNTWWGNEWIKSLEKIDSFTNRLPRGKRYANNGSVVSVELKGEGILAKVKGSKPKPYTVVISLEPFKENEIKAISEIINENYSITSDLLIGKLSEDILPLLANKGIKLFPENWKDIRSSCSCPDWANPCKHLAAVYYIVAREIDKNPFIVFNLKGVSTQFLIESAGINVNVSIPEKTDKDFSAEIKEESVAKYRTKNNKTEDFPDISFNPFALKSIFTVLCDNTLFYSGGNFKNILYNAYENVAKNINNLELNENINSEILNSDFYLIKNKENFFNFFVTPILKNYDLLDLESKPKTSNFEIPFLQNDNNSVEIKKIKGSLLNIDTVIDFFVKIPVVTKQTSLSVKFISYLVSISLSFIKSFSFIPKIKTEDAENGENEKFYLIYEPVVHDIKTEKAVEYLKNIMPYNFFIDSCSDSEIKALSDEEVINILSLIITNIFKKYSEVSEETFADTRNKRSDNKVLKSFFKDYVYIPDKFDEQHTGRSIANWLERFSVRNKKVSPVIVMDLRKKDTFSLNVLIEDKKNTMEPIFPLEKLFEHKKKDAGYYSALKLDILKQISVASEYMPELRKIVDKKGKEEISLDLQKMSNFLLTSSKIFEILGIKFVLPKDFVNLNRPQLKLQAKSKSKVNLTSFLSLNAMFDFSWKIAIGGEEISKKELSELLKSAGGLIRFRNRYLFINPDEVKNLMERLKAPVRSFDSKEILKGAFAEEIGGYGFDYDETLKSILENILKPEKVKLPSKLKAKLRPYQERGFIWLYSNTVKGLGSCIADDMGLGKTLQVIALLLKLKEEKKLNKPGLVVCPTTLLGNWQKECEKFAPSLDVLIHHGLNRAIMPKSKSKTRVKSKLKNSDIYDHIFKDKDLIITTYGTVRSDIDYLKELEWGLVIVDEAQNIKNPLTDQTRAVKSIKSDCRIAMSGTPVENRLTELWSIFDFINKGYLLNLNEFQKQYSIPIEKYMDRNKIENLKKSTSPFLLRRLKTDKSIINDLPKKNVNNEYCNLTKEQAALYMKTLGYIMAEIETSKGIDRKGLVLKLIGSLKQICNHPVNYIKKGEAAKELSGKSLKMIELIDKILDSGEKALIFTQYKEMGDILVKIIEKEFKLEPIFFHGGVPRKKRDEMVEEFQNPESLKSIMILSLKAGGTGLNLTSAANVIHYDLWWNPAVEDQATDRAYRIGQKKDVSVYRLITLGTFEEKIDEMITSKKTLANLTVSAGEQMLTEMSDKKLKEIFSLNKNI